MAETPDFEKLAKEILSETYEMDGDGENADDVEVVAARLRLVWNARGAADIAKLEFEIPGVRTSAEPAGALTRALRSLDR